MDGTIYLDEDLFDGTLDFLNYVKKIGGRYIFLTNNSSKGIDKYIEKLDKLGIKSTADDFLTSTDATVLYLKKKSYKKIYAFGTISFKEQLKNSGLPITDKLEDDIACGVNAGISSVFVLSGEGTVEDVKKSEVKPEYIYNDIKELYLDLHIE